MKQLPIAILFLLSLPLLATEPKAAVAIHAPFSVPAGAEVLSRDDSGKTWRMSGRLERSLAEGRKALADALAAAGWHQRHETPLDKAGTHLLSLWTKGGESLLLLVWQGGDSTYFSWGTFTE